LLKTIITSVMSVCPHGTTQLPLDGFWWNLIFEVFFRKYVEKIEVLLKSDKNNGHFTWRRFTFITISRWMFLRIRGFSNKSFREKTHILYSVTFVFPENGAVCEIMSKNVVEPERPQTIWRLRVAYWISKVRRAHANARARAPTPPPPHPPTHTHAQREMCNAYCFSVATMVLGTRLSVTLYVHCLSCYIMAFWLRRCVVSEMETNVWKNVLPPSSGYYPWRRRQRVS
jgi:hypothetical protein